MEFYPTESSAFEPAKKIEVNEASQDAENIWRLYVSDTLMFPKSNRGLSFAREQRAMYSSEISSLPILWRDFVSRTPADNIIDPESTISEPEYENILGQISDIPDSREETDYWVYYSDVKSDSAFRQMEKLFYSRNSEDLVRGYYERFLEVHDIQIQIHKDEISRQFDIVKTWNDSWTDFGLERPSDLVIFHSENVVSSLLDRIITAGYEWISPVISGDGDGNVSVIWYKQERELHLQIGENDVEYFKVWGINIDTEMEVDFLRNHHFLTLWKWLINE